MTSPDELSFNPTANGKRQVIEMLLWCPECGERHIDEGELANKPHHTHACQHCGMVWRPALMPTVGVQFLPGFKDKPKRRPRLFVNTAGSKVSALSNENARIVTQYIQDNFADNVLTLQELDSMLNIARSEAKDKQYKDGN